MPQIENGYLIFEGNVWWVSEKQVAEEGNLFADCSNMVFYPMQVQADQKTICPKLNENNIYVG